eukprot:UN30925
MNRLIRRLDEIRDLKGDTYKPVVVVLMCTEPKLIEQDPRIQHIGRLDQSFFIPLPNKETRAEFLQNQLKFGGKTHSTKHVSKLVQKTVGFSLHDIEKLCRELKVQRIMKKMTDNKEHLSMEILSIVFNLYDQVY